MASNASIVVAASQLQKCSTVSTTRSTMAIETPKLDELYSTVTAHFAYFEPEANKPAFMENAGGSQVPNVVIDAIADYMRTR